MFQKLHKFSFLKKKPKKKPENREKPNQIFSSQTVSKEAKIEKFGAFDAKLHFLVVHTIRLSAANQNGKLHVLCISKYLLDVVLLMNLDTITTHFYFLSILTSACTETDRVC